MRSPLRDQVSRIRQTFKGAFLNDPLTLKVLAETSYSQLAIAPEQGEVLVICWEEIMRLLTQHDYKFLDLEPLHKVRHRHATEIKRLCPNTPLADWMSQP